MRKRLPVSASRPSKKADPADTYNLKLQISGSSLVVSRNGEHALKGKPRALKDVRLDCYLELVFDKRPQNILKRIHFHVRAMQAAADAAVGHDKFTVREALFHLVYDAAFSRDDEGLRVRILFYSANHGRGRTYFVSHSQYVFAAFGVRDHNRIGESRARPADIGPSEHIVSRACA